VKEVNKRVNREQIMEAIRQLAQSQGSYSRFYRDLCEMRDNEPERFDKAMEMLEEKQFRDTVDLVLYLET
jgi:hypothetical protein